MTNCFRLFVLVSSLLLFTSTAHADIIVAIGPTAIPRGDAVHDKDITISNGVFAVAFSVQSASPWGVARGGIVDIAPIHDGVIGYDIASLADFLPDTWNDWPTTYQKVTIEKQTPDEVVIKTLRDWHAVELDSTYTIRDGDSKIHLTTTMTNKGKTAFKNLKSGFVSWPDGGHLFGAPVPNVTDTHSKKRGNNTAWTASYDERWAIGLHAASAELVEYDGRDRYHSHELAIGSSRTFEAWLQIENAGSLGPLVEADITLRGLESGTVKASIAVPGGVLPAMIVRKDDQFYAWTLGKSGRFEMKLPVGEYELYATAKGYAIGNTKRVEIRKDKTVDIDFGEIAPPGMVEFQVSEEQTRVALDARISIKSGPKPTIGFFGRSTLFTELNTVGQLTAAVSPGQYEFAVSAGGGFSSVVQLIRATVESATTIKLDVEIKNLATPIKHGWYNADLHHHSDVLDGFSDAEFVLRSELASGVDIAFLSDHDSVINNAEMHKLAKSRDIPFMHGIEMSPSWGHFNAFPLDHDKSLTIEPSVSSVQEIFTEARRMGADLIEVNHGFRPYGYFTSQVNDSIPGGYDHDFQLVEMEAPYFDGFADRNRMTAKHMWQLWNQGRKVYIAAGSDVHDVWQEASGSARTYVHVDGELTIEKFVTNLKAGQAFASLGPLIYPEIMFGSEITRQKGDELIFKYSLQSVSGLKSAQLIFNGVEVESKKFTGNMDEVHAEFELTANNSGWVSLIVEDEQGAIAYGNPVWLTLIQ